MNCMSVSRFENAFCNTVHKKNVDMDAPDIYTDCRTLYNTDLSGKRYDVVFMDIDFSGENNIARLFSDSYAVRERCSDGLALGTYLRHILGHQNFDIIYVTSHENYAIHAIPIRPAAFVQKPVTFQKIAHALDDMLYYRDISRRIFKMYQQQISGACAGVPYSLSEQLRKKGVSANTDSRISFYGKLSEVQQEPCFSSFIQIHKSYLVNPDYIDHISSNTVFLQGSSHEQPLLAEPISRW